MALVGLGSETRRLGFKPASWAQWQNASDSQAAQDEAQRDDDRKALLCIDFFARDEAQREERRAIINTLVKAYRENRRTLSTIQAMASMLQTQWRNEAQVHDAAQEPARLRAELARARNENARLKGESQEAPKPVAARPSDSSREQVRRERDQAQRAAGYRNYSGSALQRAFEARGCKGC